MAGMRICFSYFQPFQLIWNYYDGKLEDSIVQSSLRFIFLILSLTGLAVSLWHLAAYWEYQEAPADVHQLMTTTVNAQSLDMEINKSIDEGRFDDARMYINIGKQHGYGLYYDQYQQKLDRLDTKENRLKNDVGNFVGGFVSGKGNSGAGLAGAITADFTVVGDIRDLHTEHKKYQENQPVDKLVASLSGVGIGLTALTIGSAGTTAPAKVGVSVVKMAKKTSQLTIRFQKQILKLSRQVFDWDTFINASRQSKGMQNMVRAAKSSYNPKAVRPIERLASQVNQIQNRTSVIDTVRMMRYVESTDDLRHLQKVTLKHGKNTKGYLKLLGKSVLRGGKILKKTAQFMIWTVSTIVSAIFSLIFLFPARKN